jgi:hypothetical protein
VPDSKYGRHHQELRKAYKRYVDAGVASCWRCGERIDPGTPWHLGHSDDGSRYEGPEHQRCNLEAQNRLRAADARRWRAQADDGSYRDADGVLVRPW